MLNSATEKLIIIGSGPAGLTAGIYSARANLHPLIIEGKNPGGQLMSTSFVENWPSQKSILGPKLMIEMRDQAKQLGCRFISDEIIKTDFSQRPFKLFTNKNKELQAQSIIIATGASPNKLHIPGESEYWGKGVTTCAVCDGAFYPDKNVLIVGGGDTAMEDASFMTKFTNKITIVQIESTLTASHAMQQRILNNPHIKIIYNSTVTEFKGNGSHITSVVIKNKLSAETHDMPIDGVFLAIGLKPNTVPFQGQIELNKWGYIQVTNHTQTSVNGIFAAGDAQDFRYRQAITSAGSGCMAALDAERFLNQG